MKLGELGELIGSDIYRDDAWELLLDAGFNNSYLEIEMDSALVDAHTNISYAASSISQHSHSFYEIIFCVQGELEYLMGVHRFPIQAKDIIIVPPGVIHSPILPKTLEHPYKRYVFWVSATYANTLRSSCSEILDSQDPIILRTAGTKWEYMQRYFVRGVREAEMRAPGWQICLCGNAAQLLVHVARAAHEIPTSTTNLKEDLLEQILEYIQNNLREKLTVPQTSQEFHISPSTLTHLFHKEMGISFYRCIMQRRLAESKNLIAKGLSMEDVSISIGFREYSAFYRAFKAEFGISPMQYRRRITES